MKNKVLIGVIALLGSLVVFAPPASAETTIAASTNVASARVRTTVYVQGTVDPARATPTVVVQRVIDHKWADRASGAVNPTTGAFRIAITPAEVGTYKLRVRSGGGTRWSPTFYLRVTPPPSISASLSATSVYVGSTVSVRGKVTPPGATTRVVVQRAVNGAWVDRQTGNASSSTGEFSIAITPSQVGTYTLRVRSNGGSIASGRMTLTVRARPSGPKCDPNYTGCVPIASDVDCAGGSGNGPAYVAGPIRVIGTDIYGLDSDHDGIACE